MAASFRFHLEQPAVWTDLPRATLIRGWCFSEEGGPVNAIRLRVGDRMFAAVIDLARPDVHAAFPSADARAGFEIRCHFPGGRIEFALEARRGAGPWELLCKRIAHVQRRWLPLWAGPASYSELIASQAPVHMTHAPRAVIPDNYPAPSTGLDLPRLAIVTPSYQQARFLAETIDSVLGQQGVACDYVVEDGGSTDGSLELIRTRAGSLKSWSSGPDAGQADAIARGFSKTTGGPNDVMAWINSDDFYLPGALAFVAGYFAKHPEVDVLYGHRLVVDENSCEIARWFLPRHDPEVLRLNDFVPQEAMFWRRRIWERAGGIDRTFRFALDWDLLLRFQAAGAHIARVPFFLACFRIHAAQKTAARMHDVGQREIEDLRARTHSRLLPAAELENHPRLRRYLRLSALIEFLWQTGVRAP